jgi:hypothetical protein
MPVSLYQVMGVMALSYAINLLPISINGYGVREIALTTLYVHVGATLEQASTLAVVTRFILLVEALPGALWLPSAVPAINGGASEVGASDGGASEVGASEGGASEGGASEGGASEGGEGAG